MKAYVCTVWEIEHHDVVRAGIVAYKFGDKSPREWPKQALKTAVEATESCMVEAVAEYSF